MLVEEINDDGPAILIVRGLRGRLGDWPTASASLASGSRKIVTNRTSRAWHSFELELRERLEQTSTYEDGLSFGQATQRQRPFTSDRYATVDMTDEPLDSVVFSDGLVAPGETVTVTVTITDYTPRRPVLPAPATGGAGRWIAAARGLSSPGHRNFATISVELSAPICS